MLIRKRMAAALVAIGAVLGAPGVVAAQECELKLGVVGPFSGGAAQWGIAMRTGVEFAVLEVNSKGGLPVGDKKCHVQTIEVDAKYSAQGAASAANRLASEKVRFVMGPVGSPEVSGIKPVATRYHMLLMLNSYAKNAIGPEWPLAFHVSPGPSGWAAPLVEVAKEKFGMENVVIIAPNDQGGTDIAPVVAKAYEQQGIESTEEYFKRGTANFSPLVARVLDINPDAVDLVSTPTVEAGTLVKQLRQAGFEGPIGKLGGPGTEEIARIAGGMNVLGNYYWFEPVLIDEQTEKMTQRYTELAGSEPPDHTFFYLWAAGTRMVLKAISEAGTIEDTELVAQTLRELPVKDKNLGDGLWIGQKFFGINQELSLPFGMGIIEDGVQQPMIRMPAATGN